MNIPRFLEKGLLLWLNLLYPTRLPIYWRRAFLIFLPISVPIWIILTYAICVALCVALFLAFTIIIIVGKIYIFGEKFIKSCAQTIYKARQAIRLMWSNQEENHR